MIKFVRNFFLSLQCFQCLFIFRCGAAIWSPSYFEEKFIKRKFFFYRTSFISCLGHLLLKYPKPSRMIFFVAHELSFLFFLFLFFPSALLFSWLYPRRFKNEVWRFFLVVLTKERDCWALNDFDGLKLEALNVAWQILKSFQKTISHCIPHTN